MDVEESKTQENAKLQLALEEIQLQFKETKLLHLKEMEAAKKTAEIVPVIKEVPVDTELMEKLTSENEKLKVENLLYYIFVFFFLPRISKQLKTKKYLEFHSSYAVPGQFAGAED